MTYSKLLALVATTVLLAAPASSHANTDAPATSPLQVTYHTVKVNDLDVFYREAGPRNAPTVLLLHGFPTSSHMFRELIPRLADRYHVVAPDYPGFGQSSAPPADQFAYTFEHLSDSVERLTEKLGLTSYSLYVMDYGAPVGFRLALRHPERVSALVIQNGNGYEAGLLEFWDQFRRYWADPSAANRDALRPLLTLPLTQFQYLNGAADPSRVSPDNWVVDQAGLDRPGNADIQLDLFLDYRTNVDLYPAFHDYFRQYQPPTLILWGKNDVIFPTPGATAFLADLPNAKLRFFDAGHFALETDGIEMAKLIRRFLARETRRRN